VNTARKAQAGGLLVAFATDVQEVPFNRVTTLLDADNLQFA
jgi:hypothetical protein